MNRNKSKVVVVELKFTLQSYKNSTFWGANACHWGSTLIRHSYVPFRYYSLDTNMNPYCICLF